MIFERNGRVRLTPSELNRLRKLNARNGEAVNNIKTCDELLAATLGGLSSELAADIFEFLETGSSPLTRKGRAERESPIPIASAAEEPRR